MDGAPPRPPPVTLPDWVPRRLIGADEYQRMGEAGLFHPEERVELIEGQLISMSPMGAPHVGRTMILIELLGEAARGRAVMSAQSAVRLGDCSEPEPDLVLLRPPARRYLEALPTPSDILLIIEVADSTLAFDLGVKAGLYARHAILEYWVVDLRAGLLHVHRAPADGTYTSVACVSPGTTIEPVGLPGLVLATADLLA